MPLWYPRAGSGLLRIDCGVYPGVDYGEGKLLRVRTDAGTEVAESPDPTGLVQLVWRAP